MTVTQRVRIDVEAAAELSLSMVENAVPLVARLAITNTGAEALTELAVDVALLPDYSAKWTAHVSAIPPGGTFNIDTVAVELDRERLVNQLERAPAELVVWVREAAGEAAGGAVASAKQRVDVLAYNEWSQRTPPQLLAAFVLPNHPVVAELLRDARLVVERLTGNAALDGYQSGSANRVAAIVRAVYETLQARGITYSNPPASFEVGGQKIRTPEQVMTEQVATCLDVSVLVAACLEQAGLHALVVTLQGHALPGVWLDDYFTPDAVLDEPSTLRKLVELERILVVDSSAAVSKVPFDVARRTALRHLETMPLLFALDVQGARKQLYRPLPARTGPGYAAVVEVPAAVPAAGPASGSTSGPTSGPTGVPRMAEARQSAKTRHPRIEAWKQRLLDTSLRNRLLNFRDTKQSLDLVCAELGPVEDLLANGKELTLRGRPPILGGNDPRSARMLETRLAEDAVKVFLGERLGHGELYSQSTDEQAAAKLTTIYRGAREVLEETGTNALCMTFGILHWYESETSEEPRRAPILLVPVQLVRDARTSSFSLQATGEDARLNVTLFEKLRIDTGIVVPELTELPLDQAGVDVTAVLQAVRAAIVNLRRWEVKDELHLGLFSFAKFQMWADLEQNVDVLLESPVLGHLLGGKGEPYPNAGAFPEPRELDARLSPKDLVCPMDADASQLAAVAAAADGKTFVLQGPPGTGKSQTITNLITHCISQGKRVLFVAEKAAALEVVQRRLKLVGLDPFVLELHSHKAGKLQVLEQFRAAMETAQTAEPATWGTTTDRLAAERRHLNEYVQALHRQHDSGFSIFFAMSRLNALADAPLFEVPASCAESVESAESFARLRQHVEDMRSAVVALAPIATSPWHGCRLPGWTVSAPGRVVTLLSRAIAQLDEAKRAAAALAARLGAGTPVRFADVEQLCAVVDVVNAAPVHGTELAASPDWATTERDASGLVALVRSRAEALARLGERYTEGLFALDLDALSAKFQRLARAFVLFAWWGLRGAKKALRAVARGGLPGREEIAADLERARALRDQERQLVASEGRGGALFGEAWRALDTEPAALERALAWAKRMRAAVVGVRPGLLGASVADARGPELVRMATEARERLGEARATLAEIDQVLGADPLASRPGDAGNAGDAGDAKDDEWVAHRARVERWAGDTARLRDWHAFLTAASELRRVKCERFVDAVARGELAPEVMGHAFERSVYQAWLDHVLVREPALNTFNGDVHSRHVSTFAELDRTVLADSRAVARARVSARAPRDGTTATGGELGVLKKQLQLKRRHMPIRKLLGEIPSLAARLKPCFLMSPMSVATYLDPRTTRFDVVVFDEASQIPTHDAAGVLARATSAIVVGDSKQLPPTSFFQGSASAGDAPDDNDFEELESILDECIAAGLPERRLDWHYRSRHESLIAFSNHHYYRNKLNTFPSAFEIGHGRGVRLVPVAGFYDKGESRSNTAEAQAVVADLVGRLRGPEAGKRTYGIVTFSMAQQTLVEDLLDRARAQFPEIEPYFAETLAEPVIVKNLENIQGDERDVMIFSICYGPDRAGKVSMNFGPLNRDGGERRLNVAVTRAREELVVYSTLSPDQIDLTRTKAVGVKHLKTFLDYARRGPQAIAEALAVDGVDAFDSPFESQVCEALRAMGHTIHTQVGCAGYRIDLGVVDPDEPGRYLLAVECDGAYYHSARSARERDRLRSTVLEGLGWKIHRIWSTDWWQDRQRELQKLRAAIELAKTSLARTPAPYQPPPLVLEPIAATAAVEAPAAIARAAASGSDVVPYEIAQVAEDKRAPEDVHDDRYAAEVRALIDRVLAVEAPLSLRVLGRRVAPYFGMQKTSQRFEDRLRTVIGRGARIADDVVWRHDQDPATYSLVRLASAEARREVQEIPVEEVANAVMSVLRGSIALEREELVKITARTLGFSRTGDKVASHVQLGVSAVLELGRARLDGDKIVLA